MDIYVQIKITKPNAPPGENLLLEGLTVGEGREVFIRNVSIPKHDDLITNLRNCRMSALMRLRSDVLINRLNFYLARLSVKHKPDTYGDL